MTATSVSESIPSVLAVNSRPSLKVTFTLVALETTWRLVTMSPRASITTPEPVPRCGPGDGSGVPGPKKRRRNGAIRLSSSSSPPPFWPPCAGAISTSMRTTDGRSARATAEKADDRTRASLGASVLGVTAPPGCSAGGGEGSAGEAAGDEGEGGDDGSFAAPGAPRHGLVLVQPLGQPPATGDPDDRRERERATDETKRACRRDLHGVI